MCWKVNWQLTLRWPYIVLGIWQDEDKDEPEYSCIKEKAAIHRAEHIINPIRSISNHTTRKHKIATLVYSSTPTYYATTSSSLCFYYIVKFLYLTFPSTKKERKPTQTNTNSCYFWCVVLRWLTCLHIKKIKYLDATRSKY